jgi:hypothetical protein
MNWNLTAYFAPITLFQIIAFQILIRLIALQKWTARKFSLALWKTQEIRADWKINGLTGQATQTYYWKLFL